MPRFATISPTHLDGAKPAAWKRFLEGGYIALGWNHTDYSDFTLDEIVKDIRRSEYQNEKDAIASHINFNKLEVGDIVAVNNVRYGLFGIGVILSDYQFEQYKHATGHENIDQYYSHFRKVQWIDDTYRSSAEIVAEGETSWKPRGTLGLVEYLPDYVSRLLETFDHHVTQTSMDSSNDQELIGYEGRMWEELRLHKWVERDKRFIIALRKKLAHIKCCMACGLDSAKEFDIARDRFLEAHHIVPLYQRRSDVITITRECDIALLCPNCHTLMHRYMSDQGGRALSVAELKAKLPTKQ